MTISDIDWFEWNGVKCTVPQYGMHVLSQPSIVRPLERSEQVNIPGRSGTLTLLEGEDIYDNIALSCSCVIDDISKIPAISGWLKGSGKVKFPDRPDGFYKARIANQISFEKAVQGNPHRLFSVQFQCEPFFYYDSGDIAMNPIEASGGASTTTVLNNPGNIASEPLMSVVQITSGAQTGTIICGESTMLFDFSGHDHLKPIKVDSQAKIIYQGAKGSAANPLTLMGTRVTGDWLTIPSGTSNFVFSGDILRVTITPRWRAI